ncbi:hypothetical protein CVT24_004786 [Panaeolus cyanescens]|uniref:MYND-type domain-containing protein n=1 Tax=Panaeolus cyanescens TaxID=181874 RepID=A0A409VEI2_9AGAR|nr:hypothetical protein CVT24_004786 [Panaeolus cyanescens]
MPGGSNDNPAPISLSKVDGDRVIDIHDISVILSYERGTTEPRFRHTKLREVATTSEFRTIQMLASHWTDADPNNRTGIVFDRIPDAYQTEDPDLPTNMTHWDPEPSTRDLTPKQLETCYWQARNHDGCFRTVTLLQHFFDLLPFDTPIRIRTASPVNHASGSSGTSAKKAPVEYVTLACRRKIVEFYITNVKHLTAAIVFPDNKTYITGATKTPHAVIGFSRPEEDIDTILDLSALQFGDAGRGYKGNDFFVFEPIQDYVSTRLPKYGESNTFKTAKVSEFIGPAPDDEFLIDVAQRAKKRWENRKQVPFCAYCGAPPRDGEQMAKCSGCKEVFYCSLEHQRNSWPFHKLFCKR